MTTRMKTARKGKHIGAGVSVAIELRDPSGNLVDKRCKDDDITLNNWLRFFTAVMSPSGGDTVSVTLDQKDASGTDRVPTVYGGLANAMWANGTGSGIKVCAGDGGGSTPTPTRSAFKLTGELLTAFCGPAVLGVNAVVLSATAVNSGSTFTLREVGLSAMWPYSNSGNLHAEFLLFWDSVSDLSVTTGYNLTITYTFTWP